MLSLDKKLKIIWHFKNSKIIGFGFNSKGKVKKVLSKPENIAQLRKALKLKVFSLNINDFYVPIKLLGQGLTSKVYLAKEKWSGSLFAIKTM